MSISRDITERVQTEQKLTASEALFRTLATSLPSMIFVTDAIGSISYANPQFEDYTGLDADALLGEGWLDAMHPEDQAAVRVVNAACKDEQIHTAEFRVRARNGEYRTFLYRRSCVRNQQGATERWVGTFTDIQDGVTLREQLAASRNELLAANAALEAQVSARTSELVRVNRALQAEIRRREAMQTALIQSQKLEALGQLTSGISHDFNNILAVIAGGLRLIARRVEDEQAMELIGHCETAVFKGAKLIKQMLAFARQEVLAPVSVDLSQLSADLSPLIAQAVPGVAVSMEIFADAPAVIIDPVLLETALLNLAVNARDAMPNGGDLSITARVWKPGDLGHPAELGAVKTVAIVVKDNGCGMPPEVVQRVTEPFFTTKGPGSGTGLGLAMVHGFVTQSGGALRISSRLGKGTTVTLHLPCADEATTAPAVKPVATTQFALLGVGAILVVDDDPAVCAVTAAQLRSLGYSVSEAANFAEAMAHIDTQVRLDCVLSDVVMPGIDGVSLAAAIRSSRPDIPILFMTGRADSDRVAGEVVMQKPFKLTDLAGAVAEAIHRPLREQETVVAIEKRCKSKCVADMLAQWRKAKVAGKAPLFAAFHPDACSEPSKLAVIEADAAEVPMRFKIVAAGEELYTKFGRSLDRVELDVRGADGLGSAEESYRRSVKTRLPVFDYMRMNSGDGAERFERVILPYSCDGRLVDRLVSVVVFASETSNDRETGQ